MSKFDQETVAIRVTEPRQVPPLSIVFGFGPMIPFASGAVLAWFGPASLRPTTIELTILWGCAICTFLSGVRRGVSFRTMGGPTVRQIATMLWLFCAGFGALLCWAAGVPLAALALLALAYLSIAILDPIAARAGEAPLFFARLRPVQMVIPVASVLALMPLT